MSPRARSKTILVVEDDEPTRTMYRDALRHAGYDVIGVEDGLDALRRIEETLPDVVILDLMLPRLAGWDVYKEMRANPRTSRVPVVIVTASDARELEADSLRHFLRKPVSPDTLVVTVENAFSGRSARPESSGE
jgi:DNA-binding response OmpR family regulator